MPRNVKPAKPVDDEEDDGGSSEEVVPQESDSESEQTATAMAMQDKSKASPPPPQSSSSSEEEEFGSETVLESDSNVKPLASGQKSSNGARKAKSKPNAPEPEPEPATPTKPVVVASKRPAEEDTDTATATPTKDSKKKKKKIAECETTEKKTNNFQRLWTEDDEIVMLEGMIDYTDKKQADPMTDLNGFHDFIKKNLHIDFSRAQLQDKIKRLKKKFENNKSKEKVDKERTFTKPHEQKTYVLSKMIWGDDHETAKEKANGSVVVRKTKTKLNGESEEEVMMAKKVEVNRNSTTEEMMLRSGGEIYESGQGGLEWESDWKKLRLEELELYYKQLELRLAQSNLVLGAIERGDQ